ncbi:MAG TPA: GntR family transcriptional regulator [Xanthobacteraceae bacterium]|nr:GntR family transcriptional regulator [Xanthobacteraceae bacterium]
MQPRSRLRMKSNLPEVASKRGRNGRRGRPSSGGKLSGPAFARTRPAPRSKGESLGDFAYRIMREAIRSGRFRPGEHLREADVAQWLGISRTPVREAFHRLISEGLLTDGPWNGALLAELDSRQLTELYAVREALEGIAASLAAQHASEDEIATMFRIAETEARHRNDPAKLVVINAELHQAFYQAAHNRYLLQSLNTVVDALGLLRHSTFILPGSIETAHRQHLQIIRAIRDRKPAEAERVAREHVRQALHMRLQLPAYTSAAERTETTAAPAAAERLRGR